SDKTHPLLSNSTVRTGEGRASGRLKSGTGAELWKETNTNFSGAPGKETAYLNIGCLAVNVPAGISFSVITPTSVVQMQGPVEGVIGFDGNITTVSSISGSMALRDPANILKRTVSTKQSVHMFGAAEGYRVQEAQFVEDCSRLLGPIYLAEAPIVGSPAILLPFLAVGAGVGIIAANQDDKPASPSGF
ncbi:MAG: hypothetical protein L0Y62_03555, partial [Nitrospirae bacterium]|nr:hypothetical protein [Nitrospirota bacterium]